MGRIINKVFTGIGTWVAPAGITSVSVVPNYPANFPVTMQGQNSVLALTSQGSIYGWGANFQGQLGIGNTTSQSSPVAVVGGLTFSRIMDVGNTNSAAITNVGKTFAWGGNSNGQAGVGASGTQSSPVAVVGGQLFTQLSFLSNVTTMFGLTGSGSLYSWGVGSSASGTGVIGGQTSSPVAVVGGLNFAQIAFGSSTVQTFGLTLAGKLFSWGTNAVGELGVGDVATRSTPTAVVGGLTFSQIFTGNSTTYFYGLTTSGSLYGWGSNSSGCLGVGDVVSRSSPTAVVGGLTFSQVVTINTSTIALTNHGKIYSWGNNALGQLGLGDVVNRSSPIAVASGLTFSQIFADAAGATYYALTTSGQLYSWGANSFGVLGVGDTNPRSTPTAVVGGLTFSQINVNNIGSSVAYGITPNGALYSWGANTSGQLGVGDVAHRSSPTAVVGGLTFSQMNSTSNDSAFAVTPNGQLYSWGDNSSGQLGVGDVVSRSSPTAVVGGLTFSPTLQPLVNAIQNSTTITIVPGTSYNIVPAAGVSYFGNTPVAYGPITSLTLSYEA